jgi:hypothetical protein
METACIDDVTSVSNLRVREVDPGSDPRWDEFVTAVPGGLIYHHSAWLQVLAEAYGCTLIHLVCEDGDGVLRGILPLSRKRGLFTGHVFSSLFGTPVAGPLVSDSRASSALMHAAAQRASDWSGMALEVTVLSGALDGVPGMAATPAGTTYVVQLPQRFELLRLGDSHNHATVKRAVNKANRLGIQVRPAETERELWAWYKLYLDTMRRLAALPQSYEFFRIAWDRLHGRGFMQLLLAEHQESGATKANLLGGLVLLKFGRTVHYAYGGWSWANQALRPNDALHWRVIQDACTDGFQRYDLGGGSEKQGLAQYKIKWGAKPEGIYRYRCRTSADGIAEPDSNGQIRTSAINIQDSGSRPRQLALAILGRLPAKAVSVLSNWAHHM